MTDLLPASVRARVGGSRWLPLHTKANVGVGSRSSKAIGPGIEFAQYRDYEPGDDLRYLDRHVYARLGRNVVRQFTVEQQLRVNIVLDESASMAVMPEKWRMAHQVAALCAFVALNGSDQATLSTYDGAGLHWGRAFSRLPKLEHALERFADARPVAGATALDEIARRSVEHLPGPGLLIVISDWLMEGAAEAVRIWRARGQEILALQVLARDDAEPGDDLLGWSRLVDADTFERNDRYIDATSLTRYRDVFHAWQASLHDAVWKAEGRWVSIRSDRDDLPGLLTTFRRSGIIS